MFLVKKFLLVIGVENANFIKTFMNSLHSLKSDPLLIAMVVCHEQSVAGGTAATV